MSYELNFKADFEYKEKKRLYMGECKKFVSTKVDELSEKRVYPNSDQQEIIEDFANVLYTGSSDKWESVMYSDSYFNLSIFIEYAKWLIQEGYTTNNKVKVRFEWDGEEPSDYTEKEIIVKFADGKFKGTTKKIITKKVDFDLNSQITQH